MAAIDIGLVILTAIMFVWDLITWPIYQALQRPWEKRKAAARVRAKAIRTTEDSIVYETPEKHVALYDEIARHRSVMVRFLFLCYSFFMAIYVSDVTPWIRLGTGLLTITAVVT